MNPARIEGANVELGKPVDWDESKAGECGSLHVVRAIQDGYMVYTSQWEATEAERDALAKGAPIYLRIWGNNHPPVSLCVGVVYAPDALPL